MGACYEIDELFNEAVMTRVPIVIVEGHHDLAVYTALTSQLEFEVEVYPIELIAGYSGGCKDVINSIESLIELRSQEYVLEDYVVGIIDKDVRDFRGEIPNYSALFALKYYSMESHFVSWAAVDLILRVHTRLNKKVIKRELCDQLFEKMEADLLDCYYHSLEALKCGLDPNYQACFSYSEKAGRFKDQYLRKDLLAKSEELNDFALSLNLDKSLGTLKRISKGKWLLEVFCESFQKILRSLPQECHAQKVEMCESCKIQKYDSCLYRLRAGINDKTIESTILGTVVGEEFEYILERLNLLRK